MSEIVQFRRKPFLVNAMWFGTEKDGEAIVAWITLCERTAIWFPTSTVLGDEVDVQTTHHLELETPVGALEVPPGTWIVKEVTGDFFPFSPEDLDERYDTSQEFLMEPAPKVIPEAFKRHPES